MEIENRRNALSIRVVLGRLATLPKLLPLLCFLAVPAIGGSAVAQAIDVRDLIEGPSTVVSSGHSWLQRFSAGEERFGLVGEAELLDEQDFYPHWTTKDLERVLRDLTDLKDGDLRVDANSASVIAPDGARDSVRRALDWIRAARPTAIEIDVVLQVQDGNAAVDLLRMTRLCAPFETVRTAELETRALLCDFNVEIAQAAMTADPLVQRISTGASMAIRARTIPGTSASLVEAVVRVGSDAASPGIDTAHPGFGVLDRVSRSISDGGFVFRVEAGRPTIQEWTTHDGRRLRLRVAASPAQSAAAPAREGAAIQASALFQRTILGFRSCRDAVEDFDPDVYSVRDLVATTLAQDGAALVPSSSKTAAGTFVVQGANSQDVATRVRQRVDAALRSKRLSVRVLDVPASAVVGFGEELPAGSRVLVDVRGSLVAGIPVCFTSGTEKSYLADWNVEVAQSARIADPEIRVLHDGYTINTVVHDGETGRPALLYFDLQLERVARLARVVTPINVPMVAPESVQSSNIGGSQSRIVTTSRTPPLAMAQDVVAIEKPTVVRQDVTTRVRFGQDGTATLRRPARRMLGQDRELVVLLRIDA